MNKLQSQKEQIKQALTSSWKNITDNLIFKSMPFILLANIIPAKDKSEIAKIFIGFGIVKNQNDGREVKFPVNSAGKMVFTKKYTRAFNLLFESSIRAWSENETSFNGHKKHPNIIEYHNYINKFLCTEGNFYIRFTIRETNNNQNEIKNNVHSAEITDISVYENKSTDLAGNQTGRNGALHNATKAFVDYKLAYYLEGVN